MGKLSVAAYCADQHHHMLGAGRAWFMGSYPNEWEIIKTMPAEQALDRMLDIMNGVYVKLWVSTNSSEVTS